MTSSFCCLSLNRPPLSRPLYVLSIIQGPRLRVPPTAAAARLRSRNGAQAGPHPPGTPQRRWPAASSAPRLSAAHGRRPTAVQTTCAWTFPEDIGDRHQPPWSPWAPTTPSHPWSIHTDPYGRIRIPRSIPRQPSTQRLHHPRREPGAPAPTPRLCHCAPAQREPGVPTITPLLRHTPPDHRGLDAHRLPVPCGSI